MRPSNKINRPPTSDPGTGRLRIEIRAAIIEACRVRGDPPEHVKACLADMAHEPRETWPFWLAYFRGEATRYGFDPQRFAQAATP